MARTIPDNYHVGVVRPGLVVPRTKMLLQAPEGGTVCEDGDICFGDHEVPLLVNEGPWA